jgi:hypothetical protein
MWIKQEKNQQPYNQIDPMTTEPNEPKRYEFFTALNKAALMLNAILAITNLGEKWMPLPLQLLSVGIGFAILVLVNLLK